MVDIVPKVVQKKEVLPSHHHQSSKYAHLEGTAVQCLHQDIYKAQLNIENDAKLLMHWVSLLPLLCKDKYVAATLWPTAPVDMRAKNTLHNEIRKPQQMIRML